MLTLDNVLKLLDNGFTREEIMNMAGEPQAAAEEPVAVVTPAPDTAPIEPPVEMAVPAGNEDLINAIQDLKRTIQASNISGIAQPVQPDLQEQANDTLLKLYNM